MGKLNAFLAILAMLFAAAPAPAADTVFVVRHFEKAAGDDPPLSAQGARNAAALATMLAESDVQAIFATPTRRAMESAEPLAKALGISVTPYEASDPAALVAAVAEIPGNVLIVGHSNTVPELVARFGGKQAITLTDQDYGTLFVITPGSGDVTEVEVEPGA